MKVFSEIFICVLRLNISCENLLELHRQFNVKDIIFILSIETDRPMTQKV